MLVLFLCLTFIFSLLICGLAFSICVLEFSSELCKNVLSVKGFFGCMKFRNTNMEDTLCINVLSLFSEDSVFAYEFGDIFTESCVN